MRTELVVREYKGRESAWPSIAFTVRRPFGRALRVDQPSDCPLIVTAPKRHWRIRWAGLDLGAWEHLDLTVTNRSGQAVHSFALRCIAGPGGHPSGAGVQPEGGLAPDAFVHAGFAGTGYTGIHVDFVQFVQGAVWYSGDQESLVTEAGVEAGSRAASVHLQSVLGRSDAATVMAQLARVHADVVGPMSNPLFGPFGFYTGVNNMAVRVRHAFSRDGLDGVERLLWSDRVGG